jgi:poly-gamma-glutamate capsule biosynthesis protein CapA/YwtB (metallophosphatase superfamily)
MIGHSHGAPQALSFVPITDLTQLESWPLAQTGDVAAIAHLLTTVLHDPPVRVEVSWRDRTLYVFLTVAQMPLPEGYPGQVYVVVSGLAPPGLTHLKVIDGTPKRLVHRWHQDFTLVVPPEPQPRRVEAVTSEGHPLPPPAVAPFVVLPVQAAEVWAGGRDRPLKPRVSSSGWRWVAMPGVVALGFGLAAGVTQWRYDQPRGSPVETTIPVTVPGSTTGASALALPALPQAVADTQPAIAPAILTIKAVGDIIPGTDYQRYRLPDDWQYLFRSIQYHLGEADITFGNFESTFTEVPHSAKDTGRANTFAFRTPPWYASVLKEAGFDVLSVANNHSMDFFEQGFEDTIANIEASGMKAVGRKGEILVVEAQGRRVAFIAFSTFDVHNTVNDLESAIALVEAAQQQADIVVVSFHAGKEGTDAVYTRDQEEFFYSENRGNVVRFSHTMVDHGADLVLGHGPHVPRAIERYNNKLIAYSLGNFLGYRSLSTVGPLGTSLILQADLDAQGNFVGGRIIPVALDKNGVPYLDDHFGSVVLVRQFTQRDFPHTPLAIDDMGYLWPQ